MKCSKCGAIIKVRYDDEYNGGMDSFECPNCGKF